MRSEISFKKLKTFVSERKNIYDNLEFHPEADEFTAAIDCFSAKTIQNIVEVALIEGVNPDTFLTRMIKECDVENFEELSEEHGNQDTPDVINVNSYPFLKRSS